MNGVEALSQAAVLQHIGWTLIHFVWQGTALAFLLALTLAGLKSASAQSRYLAGCVAMLLMALAPMGTLRYEMESAGTESITGSSLQTGEFAFKNSFSQPRPAEAAINITGKAEHTIKIFPVLTVRLIPWVVMIWIFGVFVLSIRLFAAWWRVQGWKRSHRETLDQVWLAKLGELQARLAIRKKIALVKSSVLETPAVIGWLRPIILVPASALSGLAPTQLEAILLHELSHIRRHDYLVNLLQSVVETLLFYHPAVWWVSRKIRQERENCCDDIAVKFCGDRFNYARALTILEQLRGNKHGLVLAAAGGTIGERIRRIVGVPNAGRLNPTWIGGALGLVTLIALLYLSKWVLFAGEPQKAILSAQPTNTVKTIAQTDASPEVKGTRVFQTYPVDWARIRANLKNFLPTTTGDSLVEQLRKYFALRGINTNLENASEGVAEQLQLDSISLPSEIDKSSRVLKVKLPRARMASFENALRRLAAPFDYIQIDTKWVELHDGNAPTNGLRGLLPELSDSNLTMRPCLGSAVEIQMVGSNRSHTNSIATRESQPFSAALTHAQLTNLIQILEQRGGVDLLSAPRVITANGRQARISVEDAKTIVTGSETNSAGQITPLTMQMTFGPTVDIFPQLSTDHSQIRLKIIGKDNQFAGYSKPEAGGKSKIVWQNESAGAVPMPRVLEQSYESTETIAIGSAVLFGGLTRSVLVKTFDRVPGLSDIPLVGRLFRSQSTAKQWVSLVLIVTPTLMNSYGDTMRRE